MDMGSATYLEQMKSLLDAGQITAAQLDDLVRPILAAKYHLGLFEHPYADATDQTHSEMLAKHRQAARTAAARSAVLLRNEGGVLPLVKTAKRIAVIGPLGDSKGDMNGPWSLSAKEEDSVSVFEGIRAKLPDSQVEFAEGVQIAKEFPSSFEGLIGPKPEKPWSPEEADRQMKSALDLAAKSDVVIMTLGELSGMDFEYASRSSLSLPGKQQELLEKIQSLGKPVVSAALQHPAARYFVGFGTHPGNYGLLLRRHGNRQRGRGPSCGRCGARWQATGHMAPQRRAGSHLLRPHQLS